MSMLTGRYQLRPTLFGGVRLWVEETDFSTAPKAGFRWRRASARDLGKPEIEPMIADGWRFIEERHGRLNYDGRRDYDAA